ncbi:glutaredoxin family protein [Kocuria rhizophila]|uniref:glutaredoxin family protein n=1 Tax=Kocuria rhizophila TaxID=72000 RepID=UPI00215030F2|nr:glutaredoxin family protein [Kocuria rhizophila]MCR4526278.1 glutaredoxin family protein [Kocuria rhizophila]MCT1916153.1 glutaredoxin family protein [Kocuria rhizophila]
MTDQPRSAQAPAGTRPGPSGGHPGAVRADHGPASAVHGAARPASEEHDAAARHGSGGMSPAPGSTGRAGRSGGLLSGVDWTRNRPRHEVTLLTKPGCHLCDDAREVVERVCAQTGTALREQDITGDPALTRDYAEFVPVVFVDGAPWDRWRIDGERLRAVLA